MGEIFVYQNRDRVNGMSGARQQATRVQDQIGPSLQKVAQGLSTFARAEDQYQARVDEATVMDLDASFGNDIRDIESSFLTAQGKNAVDQAKDAQQAWKQTADSYASRAMNERQRGMLNQQLAQRGARWSAQYGQHLAKETETWQVQSEDGRTGSLSVDAATLPINSPERASAMLALGGHMAGIAQRRGWSEDFLKSENLKVFTEVHKQTIGALVEAYQPKEARDYLEAHADQIAPAVLTQLGSVVREQVDNADARSFALGVDFGTAGKPVEASVDALWSALTNQESGGKQFTSSGQLLTSPVGAFGVAQLMPDTARDIARQMGDPSLADKARTDPAVNERMGRYYLGQQIAKYGNASLALAAYNAGPGRVDRWLLTIGDPRTGAISEAEWAARIPFQETRDYVRNIVAKSGGAQALAGIMPEGQALRIAREAAGTDPRRQAAFESAITGQRRIAEADQNDAKRIAREAVQTYLPNGATPVTAWTEIPPRVWNSLDPEYQNQIRGAFAADAAGAAAVKTDEEIYGALVRLKATNPGQLANLDAETYASSLGKEDFRRVQGWILEARADPDGNETPRGRAWKAAYDQVQVYARSAGIETNPDKQDDEDRARMNALQTYVGQQVDAYVQANDGRMPTTQEVAGWAAFGLRTTRNSERRGNGFAQALLGNDNSGQYGFEQGIGETIVPSAARSVIIQEFRRAGRPYDDSVIRQAYEYGLRSGRFAPTR